MILTGYRYGLLGDHRRGLAIRRRPVNSSALPARTERDAEPHLLGAVGRGRADPPAAPGDVLQREREVHRRRAAPARQLGQHAHGVELHRVELLEVDLALDPAVVPPAAGRVAGGAQARGREVGRQAARVDAHDEPVDAALAQALQAQRERDVGAGVAADLAPVEVDPRAVVDRLEAHGPLERGALVGQLEVLAVPADGAAHRRLRVVADVPDVRHRDGRPARRRALALEVLPDALVGAVEPEQPLAVDEEAAGGPVRVERLGRRHVGGLRGGGDGRERARAGRGGGVGRAASRRIPTPGAAASRGGGSVRSLTHGAQPASPSIGSDSESSSTAPPVSGPSRRTRTHWTTGRPVAGAPGDAARPGLAREREPRRRGVGEHLHGAGAAQVGDALARRLRAGRLAAAGGQPREHGRRRRRAPGRARASSTSARSVPLPVRPRASSSEMPTKTKTPKTTGISTRARRTAAQCDAESSRSRGSRRPRARGSARPRPPGDRGARPCSRACSAATARKSSRQRSGSSGSG